MISKCSIFVNAISSPIFGGSDWTLAKNTLSVFACRYGGGGVGGDGGGGGYGGGGGGGHDGGGDGGGGLVGRNVSMGNLWGSSWRWDAYPVSRQGGLGPFGPKMHLCCYTNTGKKYPSTLTIEMQTIFKQVGLFIICPVNIKEIKPFVV